jgi:aconitate hydratase
MGVLPLQFRAGENAASLKLTGQETYHITGVRSALLNGGGKRHAKVRAVAADGSATEFAVDIRVDTPQEVEYYRFGGILPYVLRQVAAHA